MQANNIWAGNDYAWRGGSRRGERFSLSCERVRVRRVVKETLPGNTKASTSVIVQFIDRDTGEVLEGPSRRVDVTYESGDKLYKVRAFDIIETWETIADEYQHLAAKQKQEEAERETRERERRERAQFEELTRKARLDAVKEFLVTRGVDPDWIAEVGLDLNHRYSYGSSQGGIRLSFEKVETAMREARVVLDAG